VALQLLAFLRMAQDFESMLKEIFGEPRSRLTQFQGDQVKKLTAKLHEIAREAVKDELTKLTSEITDLKTRLARLESERAQAAADSVESSF
jgi:polyhydroxyalkanoate synthesis regulator phasin